MCRQQCRKLQTSCLERNTYLLPKMCLLLELFSHHLTKHDAWLFIITKYEIYLKNIARKQFPSVARSCTPGEGKFNATFRDLFPFSCQPKHFLNKLCRLVGSRDFDFILPCMPCLLRPMLEIDHFTSQSLMSKTSNEDVAEVEGSKPKKSVSIIQVR